jgi:hypothetical protein
VIDADFVIYFSKGKSRLWTFAKTKAAILLTNAVSRIVGKFRIGMNALGIGAPLATEGAEFEKDVRPDSGTVIDAKVLDVENQAQRSTVCGLTRFHGQSIPE